MKSQTVVLGVLVASFALCVRGQTDSTQVAAGRAALAAHNITNANAQFAAAVAISAANPTANVFYAATRLLVLPSQPAGSALLDTLGFGQTNRDIYHWGARLPTGTNGAVLAPAGVNATVLTAYLRARVIPELLAAGTNLGTVTSTNFLLSLSGAESDSTAVTIDYGDVLILRFLAGMAAYFGYTINSWNVDAQLTALSSLATLHEFTPGEVLAQYPELLTFSTTNDLASAKTVFSNAVTFYLEASSFIRARPPGGIRLFNYDPTVADAEARFRRTLSDLQSALDGAVRLTVSTNYQVSLAPLFTGLTTWRSLLPVFNGNDFLLGSFDPSFNGVSPGLDAATVETFLGRRFVPVPNFTSVPGLLENQFLIQLNVLPGHGYVIEASPDLSAWTPVLHTFATNTVLSFTDPDPAGHPRRFFRAREQSNNLFANRYVISGLPAAAAGNNQNAVAESGEPSLAPPGSLLFAAGSPVWWSWTSPVTGGIGIISSGEQGFPTIVGVFTGTNLATLAPEQNLAANNPAEFELNAVAGTTYQIAADSAYPSGADFSQAAHGTITLEIAGPPPNDNFANRIPLGGASVTTNGWNILATIEPNEPAFPSQTVWYSWTAPASGTGTISAKSPGQPLVNIYTGTSLGSLAPVSVISLDRNYFEAVKGTNYQFQVDSATPALFALSLNFYANQEPLLVPQTPAGGAVSISPAPNTNGMYPSGTVVTLTADPAEDFVFQGWSGSVPGSATNLTVVMTNGQTVAALFRPVNDDFASRILLSGTNTTVDGSTAGATVEANEPLAFAGGSVWYSWTAPDFGSVTISEKAAREAGVTVYSGNSLTNLVPVFLDATSHTAKSTPFFGSETMTITFDANPGTGYAIQVFGEGDGFVLGLSLGSPRPPAITAQPRDASVTAGGGATFGVTAAGYAGNGPLSYQWLFNGKEIGGATNAVFSLINITTNMAGAYTVEVGNGFGVTTSAAAALTVEPAWTLTVLHAFTGGDDGADPQAGLFLAGDGNFYGTTEAGSTHLNGSIFQITPEGTLTTLHAFTGGLDGGGSLSALMQGQDGKMYGTSIRGGTANVGTAFSITTGGTLTTLHSFSGGSDGGYLFSGLTQGPDGGRYGATGAGGGASAAGTLFRLTTNGVLTTLHNFTGIGDGGNVEAGLVFAGDGNLYGTTYTGGATGNGTVFRVTTTGSFTTLHSFSANDDGARSRSALLVGSDGNFYGTTAAGGLAGFGTVFQMTTGGALTIIYVFGGGEDGATPYASLAQAADGNFYGTTSAGGTAGHGTVFRVTKAGVLTTLHSFTGGNDGENPVGSLVAGAGGQLYGTDSTGGARGSGVIFVLSPPR